MSEGSSIIFISRLKEKPMSFYRPNAIWKSPTTGEWKMGLFGFYYVNQESPDFDPEWDIEEDYSRFTRVIKGCKSADDAIETYCKSEANAGSYNIYPEASESPQALQDVERFEKMHEELQSRIDANRKTNASSRRW
jgi:hypothetical protein